MDDKHFSIQACFHGTVVCAMTLAEFQHISAYLLGAFAVGLFICVMDLIRS
jgi:hypothetical protein